MATSKKRKTPEVEAEKVEIPKPAKRGRPRKEPKKLSFVPKEVPPPEPDTPAPKVPPPMRVKPPSERPTQLIQIRYQDIGRRLLRKGWEVAWVKEAYQVFRGRGMSVEEALNLMEDLIRPPQRAE